MVKATDNELNPQSNIFAVLGNLCVNPKLLLSNKIHLSKDDFVLDLHKVIFFAINNLSAKSKDLSAINSLDIDTYLMNFDEFHAIFEQQNGAEWVQDAIENANQTTFDVNYQTLKKFTTLRLYNNRGFDISEIYNYAEININKLSEQQESLDKMTVDDIVQYFTQKSNDIRLKISDWNSDNTTFKAGDGLDGFLDNLNENPAFGYPFADKYYNTLVGGMQFGKLLLRSAGTGIGKTRTMLADAIQIAGSEHYIQSRKSWEKLPKPEPFLFISTELREEEIELILLSAITSVSPITIRKGKYSKAVKEILEHGIEVIKQMPLYFVELPDFDTQDIVSIIENYAATKNVRYVAFDYISITPKLMRSAKNMFGARDVRDDQLLLTMTETLKHTAERLDIFIETATQLNGSKSNDDYSISRTENALRGSKAIADKIDVGVIISNLTDKDRKNIANLSEDENINPYNYSVDMGHFFYKNRLGQKGIIVWTHTNLSTLRSYPLFITDYNYQLLSIEKTNIKVDEDNFSVKDMF